MDSCFQIQSCKCGAVPASSGNTQALITSLTLVSRVLSRARGHSLMSVWVEIWGGRTGLDESHTGIAHRPKTHEWTHLTASLLSRPPFWAAVDDISPLRPSVAPSILLPPRSRPAPPREIPKRRWNTLLSPPSQSDCWVIPVYSYVFPLQCVREKKALFLMKMTVMDVHKHSPVQRCSSTIQKKITKMKWFEVTPTYSYSVHSAAYKLTLKRKWTDVSAL